jgi:CrcB protein
VAEPPSSLAVGAVVAVGGALGATARYLLSLAAPGLLWPTLVVNLSGAFALGILAGVLSARPSASPLWRPFLGTGVLGGFTTFSALAVELVDRVDSGRVAIAAVYLVVTVAGGLAVAWAGLAAGKRVP